VTWVSNRFQERFVAVTRAQVEDLPPGEQAIVVNCVQRFREAPDVDGVTVFAVSRPPFVGRVMVCSGFFLTFWMVNHEARLLDVWKDDDAD